MSRQTVLDQLKDVPNILENTFEMTTPNQPIKIFEGDFMIKDEETEFAISGCIRFDWFPFVGGNFEGYIKSKNPDVFSFLNSVCYFDVIVDDSNVGKGVIASTVFKESIKIKGTFRSDAVIGDSSIAVQKVRFSIPNFTNFSGSNVKKISESSIQTARNRIMLENGKYAIIIDKCIDQKERYNALDDKGGYLITHIGEIIPKKGSISYQDTQEISNCLGTFLSYVNGRRTSAFFMQGICNEDIIWKDYSNYHVDMHEFLPSWISRNENNEISEIWQKFSDAWTDKDFRDVLDTSIHWYLECSKGSGFVEGSLIMAQTALELLYNWHVVEKKKLLVGKDSENITAANKIRMLISQLGINYEVPIKFVALQNFLKSEKHNDAPETIVQIRNAIVHSQHEKRKKLRDIDYTAKYEALQLCLWYIELSLLKILNYDGVYSNRCSANMSSRARVESVPWKN